MKPKLIEDIQILIAIAAIPIAFLSFFNWFISLLNITGYAIAYIILNK